MYVSFHKQVTTDLPKGIELPIETFCKDVRVLAEENGYHFRTFVRVTNNYYYTFLHFINGDRIDIHRNA